MLILYQIYTVYKVNLRFYAFLQAPKAVILAKIIAEVSEIHVTENPMKTLLENPILNLSVRLVLGGIFIFAAMDKIAEPDAFAKSIGNYHLIPTAGLNFMALLMPWIELVTGLFLILGVRIKASSAIIGGMLVVFLIAIISAIIRGYNINCGCFAQTSASSAAAASKVGWLKVGEDAAMLLAAAYLFFYPVKTWTLEAFAAREQAA